MNKMHNSISILLGLVLLIILAGCNSPEPVPSAMPVQMVTPQPVETGIATSTTPPKATPTEAIRPTATPDPATPTPIPAHSMRTPIPASRMQGEWHRITTADGLCTDWPLFIGVWYIGTGTTTVCYSTESVDETTWLTRTVPLGTRVTAVDKFPPGGGEMYATDAGVCWYDGVDWRCQTLAEGYPYDNIRRIAGIETEPVLMLTDAIVYNEQVYRIAELVGTGDAHPTWIATSAWNQRLVPGELSFNPEVWVGTNGYGIVLISLEAGTITRYTIADGLPSDVVRDIDVGADIWVATGNGVGRWDGEHWTAYSTADGLPSNDVRGVAAYQDTVWAATAGGAAYFDGQSWQAFTHDNGLPEGDLNGVLCRGDEIWFSTRGSGLLVFVIQTPTQDRVVQGYGDFPRLPVVAPAADGTTLALYLVEGDTAVQLMTLEDTRVGTHRADAYLSPDDRYVVCLRTKGDDLHSVLEMMDIQKAQRVVIAEGLKDVHEKGATWEELVSVAWMDAEHILYSKVRWPSSEEWVASWEAETPLPVEGEVWMSSVDGKEQRLLASGRIYQVLGASSEGKALYVTRLIPGREERREVGLALLDPESGEIKNLWPEEERGAQSYHSFKLIALPDGSQRLIFATAGHGDTAPAWPPVIWMADPESGQAKSIWTIDQGSDWSKGELTGTIYDIPRDFLWSPDSEQAFVYLADTTALRGVWRVDMSAEKAELWEKTRSLGKTRLHLLTWASEGIVIQSQNAIWLLDERGEVQGEIRFREE
jgi:hypothetical protein